MSVFDPIAHRFDIDPVTHCLNEAVGYFAVARARWARNARDLLIIDCWFVAYVVLPIGTPQTRLINTKFEFSSTDQQVHSRFRSPTGRLFYYEETIPVVNTLNKMPLSVLAARQTIGGLTKLVHRIASEELNVR